MDNRESYFLQLNDTKPYVMMSTPILLSVFNTNILSHRSSSLWLLIYSLSHGSPKGITLSASKLAGMTNQSERTIWRIIADLKDKGFIITNPVHYKGYVLNNFQCIIPKHVQDKCDEFKNRKKPINNCRPKTDLNEDYAANQEYLKMQYGEHAKNTVIYMEDTMVGEDTLFTSAEKNLPNDSSDTQSIKIFYLNKKHNIAKKDCEIFNHFEEEEDESFENQAKVLYGDLQEKWGCYKSAQEAFVLSMKAEPHEHKKNYELMRHAGNLKSDAEQIEKMVEYLKKQHDFNKKTQESIKSISIDEQSVLKKPGDRQISSGLFWWVKKQLYKIGCKKEEMAIKINEILYAVRFGSLAKIKYTQEEMPIMKSLNIALKLVKQGRWQSPASFSYGAALVG